MPNVDGARLRGWTEPGALGHAEAVADLNLLAYALAQANRPDDPARVFEAVGPTMTKRPWGSTAISFSSSPTGTTRSSPPVT
ncbi:hypothetical protein [Kitasatospora sp. DSM 101779]|uniref:hypothetical protein n=1 Tax=Kitasatospora sp. DSM 101779 TaxID=2853165 RepID=UPI0021D85A45|nr:hypothetical protein [Kitasatospora sp. DSM 101779]MCU7826075.1 hypothetical protein [Kitasatospora sp. DSM 101779]